MRCAIPACGELAEQVYHGFSLCVNCVELAYAVPPHFATGESLFDLLMHGCEAPDNSTAREAIAWAFVEIGKELAPDREIEKEVVDAIR